MEIEFELCNEEVMLGIHYSNTDAVDIDSGDVFKTNTLTLGFLFFMIHLHFLPKRNQL